MYKTRLRLDEARKCCFTWKAGNPPLDIFSSVFSLSKYFLQGTPGRGQEKLDSVERFKINKTSSAWGGTRCGAGVCERGTGPARCRCVRGCLSALSSARALGRCGRSARPGAAALSRARPRWPQSLPRPGFPRLAVHSSLQHHLQFLGYKLRWLYRGCRVACLLFTKERNIRVRPQQSLERGQVSSDRLDFVLLSLQTLSSSFQRNAARTWLMLRLQ